MTPKLRLAIRLAHQLSSTLFEAEDEHAPIDALVREIAKALGQADHWTGTSLLQEIDRLTALEKSLDS